VGAGGDLQEISLYAFGLLEQIRGPMQDYKFPIAFRHRIRASIT
jgi:hypothetical protein